MILTKKRIRPGITIDPEVIEAARLMAASHGMSMSAYVEKAIEAAIEREKSNE